MCEQRQPAFDAYCNAVLTEAYQDRGHPDVTLNYGWLNVLQFALAGNFSHGETAAELLSGKAAADEVSRQEIERSEDLVRRFLAPDQLAFLAKQAQRAGVSRAVVLAGWLKDAMQRRMAAAPLWPESMHQLFGVVGYFIFGVGLLIRRDAPELAVQLALEVAGSAAPGTSSADDATT